MPIRPFLNGAAFEPEAIRNMAVVFESVCAELGLSDKDDPATRLVASISEDASAMSLWRRCRSLHRRRCCYGQYPNREKIFPHR